MTDNVPTTNSLLLSIADDKLMLGHRNSDWTGLAPMLEEDIAFSSLAQDDIAHAQALYQLVASSTGSDGPDADALAFGRDPSEYCCASVVEIPDEFNWATALARQFVCSHFNHLRFARLSQSSDTEFASLAKRLAAEQVCSVEHVDAWMVRLGNGSDDARNRMQEALDALAPHAMMLFEQVEGEASLVETGVYPQLDGGDMFDLWQQELSDVLGRSNLTFDFGRPEPEARGGRRGDHTPHLAELLDEMCEVYRTEPAAQW